MIGWSRTLKGEVSMPCDYVISHPHTDMNMKNLMTITLCTFICNGHSPHVTLKWTDISASRWMPHDTRRPEWMFNSPVIIFSRAEPDTRRATVLSVPLYLTFTVLYERAVNIVSRTKWRRWRLLKGISDQRRSIFSSALSNNHAGLIQGLRPIRWRAAHS